MNIKYQILNQIEIVENKKAIYERSQAVLDTFDNNDLLECKEFENADQACDKAYNDYYQAMQVLQQILAGFIGDVKGAYRLAFLSKDYAKIKNLVARMA